MSIEKLAAEIQPPRQGENVALAATTTTQFFDLQQSVTDYRNNPPTPYANRFLTVEAEGSDVYIAVTLGNVAANNIDPTVTGISSVSTMCIRVAAGTSKTWFADGVGGEFRYLAYRTASGTGTLRLWCSSKTEMPR